MDNKRLYVDLHVLQTVPPSCVNRDDTGRPKTAVYGGANRARVSSQAWKHAVREYFRNLFDTGYRTKYVKTMIIDKALELSPGVERSDLEEKFDKISKTKYKIDGKDTTLFKYKDKDKTEVLFFISSIQIEKFAKLLIDDVTDIKLYKDALNSANAIDMALFGRMVANDPDLNVDACAQVAHSISTHAVQNEYDYFTAVDDCSPGDNAGAGHLGTMEFNSSTLYRYATVNAADLCGLIGSDTAEAVKGFAEAFICSMPTGKQNSYANRTLPDMVYVTIRKDQPVNLCGAFEKPVRSVEGYSEMSKKALFEHAEKVYSDFCGVPEYSFVVGHEEVLGAEKVNLSELLDKLQSIIGGVI